MNMKLIYNKLCTESPNSILSYYNKNWHSIRHEWVDGMKDGINLGNRTNNRIESINDKVKQVLTHHSTLPDFAEHFLIALKSLRTERDLKISGMFLKSRVTAYTKDSTEYKYQELVTPYAWAYILKQLIRRSEVVLEQEDRDGDKIWTCKTVEGTITVAMDGCSCSFHQSMLLPCRHMLKLREITEESMFAPDIVSDRWKINSVRSSHRLFETETETPSAVCSIVSTPKRNRKMSQSSKFRETQIVSQQLASLASESTGDQYKQRLELLKGIVQLWSNDKQCMVIEVLESDIVESSIDNICSNQLSENTVVASVGDIDNAPETVINPDIHKVIETSEQERDLAEQEQQLLDSENDVPQISDIMLPPVIKKRGRPKGMTQTIIGLPKKRLCRDKCLPFRKKGSKEIDRLLLNWFVGHDIAKKAIDENILVEEEHVESRPELVTASCLDELVNINLIKKYCSGDAWKAVENVFNEKKNNPIYICNTCAQDADTKEASVMCSSCLEWQHLSSARLKQTPKSRNWFCNNCKSSFR